MRLEQIEQGKATLKASLVLTAIYPSVIIPIRRRKYPSAIMRTMGSTTFTL
jgi:hypothetical protein